ncbi:alginate export family protein [Altericroceibacterium endophyticum]|uniref:Alginate export domain-containing protein n=1 Tax=Altericroceibacterium endophyticum TaxID=1808508 RepID=A0A6I4T8M1_9SPHN|nr:alginate export family protein [Altericroceibacterium endophyticum]MXO67147.1 hypothetical protein [Altericroceibacterium endophyticum]
MTVLRTGTGVGCLLLAACISAPSIAQEAGNKGETDVSPASSARDSVQNDASTESAPVEEAASVPAPLAANPVRNRGSLPGAYPASAQGWGPKTGPNHYMVRYAEDWSYLANPDAADVPLRDLKYIPLGLGDGSYVTLSGYEKLRYNFSSRPNMNNARDRHEIQSRSEFGVDVHLNENFRVYAELGTMQTFGQNTVPRVGAQENDLILQQLFVEARFPLAGNGKAGVMLGRQMFFDGPKPLISTREAANVPRSLNGVRLWSQWDNFRFSAFSLANTSEDSGVLGDAVNVGETLSGFNSSIVLTNGELAGQKSQIFLDPFYFHYVNDNRRQAILRGRDRRETYGARLWGNVGRFKFDWNAIKQDGNFVGRKVDAYALSANQSVALAPGRGAPRIGFHAELASGGGSYAETGEIKTFNPIYPANIIYTDTNTVTGSNLAGFAPTFSFDPLDKVSLYGEAGFYWRRDENEPIYRTNFAPYTGIELVDGKEVLQIYRARIRWKISPNITVAQDINYNVAGDVLKQAGYGNELYSSTQLHLRF